LCCSKIAKDIKVIVGTISLTDPKSQYDVVKIIKHKEYNPSNSWINDIALLQVNILFTQGNWDLYNFLFSKIINVKQNLSLSGGNSHQKIRHRWVCSSATKRSRRWGQWYSCCVRMGQTLGESSVVLNISFNL